MKKILYKRRNNPQKHFKNLSICTFSEDAQCFTRVHKGFRYQVRPAVAVKPKVEAPQIFIKKQCDSRRKMEKFRFEVKGCFYMTHERMLVRVDFHHVLNIRILWKKDFSPKKSEVLTN